MLISFSPPYLMELLTNYFLKWWFRWCVNSTSFILVLLLIWYTSLLLNKFFKNAQKSLPPGPIGLPLLGSLPFIKGDLHSYFTSLAKTYGPIFSLRLGTKIAVVISTPSVAREVLKDKDIIFANRNVPIVAKAGFYGGNDILWSPNGPEWRMMRKVCTRGMLCGPMVDSFYDIRRREVRKLVNSLWLRKMSRLDVGEEIFMTVLNTITNMLWGGGGNELAERSLGTEFRILVDKMAVLLGKPNISDFFPCLAFFDLQGIEKQMKGMVKRFDNVFELLIHERTRLKVDSIEKNDFLQALLSLRNGSGDDKTPLTMTHLKAILLDMVMGGTAATSNTMEFMLAEMMSNPQVMKKAQQELEVVVGTNNIVEESHLHKLPYLHAVMKETLRLHPGAPLLAPHCPSESCTIGGFTIPKGTSVFINVWAIQRDPLYWEDPLRFDPERFMNSEWDFSGNDFKYFPFGSGRRICVGIELGERMFLYLLASLLHSFEWNVSHGEKVDLEETIWMGLKKKKPLMALPTPRLFNEALYK